MKPLHIFPVLLSTTLALLPSARGENPFTFSSMAVDWGRTELSGTYRPPTERTWTRGETWPERLRRIADEERRRHVWTEQYSQGYVPPPSDPEYQATQATLAYLENPGSSKDPEFEKRLFSFVRAQLEASPLHVKNILVLDHVAKTPAFGKVMGWLLVKKQEYDLVTKIIWHSKPARQSPELSHWLMTVLKKSDGEGTAFSNIRALFSENYGANGGLVTVREARRLRAHPDFPAWMSATFNNPKLRMKAADVRADEPAIRDLLEPMLEHAAEHPRQYQEIADEFFRLTDDGVTFYKAAQSKYDAWKIFEDLDTDPADAGYSKRIVDLRLRAVTSTRISPHLPVAYMKETAALARKYGLMGTLRDLAAKIAENSNDANLRIIPFLVQNSKEAQVFFDAFHTVYRSIDQHSYKPNMITDSVDLFPDVILYLAKQLPSSPALTRKTNDLLLQFTITTHSERTWEANALVRKATGLARPFELPQRYDTSKEDIQTGRKVIREYYERSRGNVPNNAFRRCSELLGSAL